MDWGVSGLSLITFAYLQVTACKKMDNGVGNYEIVFGGNVLKVTSRRYTVLTYRKYLYSCPNY